MKKLMIAAAVGAFAAIANAGSINWGIAQVVNPTTGEYFNGGAGYLINSADLSRDLALAAVASGDFATITEASVYESSFASGELYESKILAGEYDGTTPTFYSLVLDNGTTPEYYILTEEVTTAKIPTSTSSKPASWDMTGSKSDWTAVPEPTSGLLLLLGVAGLALRRRRA